MKALTLITLAGLLPLGSAWTKPAYPIVDTGQVHCYDDKNATAFPKQGEPFFGQDAQISANGPSYQVNDDGTVNDQVTGLMWTQDPGGKVTYVGAIEGATKCRVGGHSDWRLPSIKELYSLIQFNGIDPDPNGSDPGNLTPFIDRKVFNFQYGDEAKGERIIDSQFATSTVYVGTTMNGKKTMFGVNFADGRIKGYPTGKFRNGRLKTFHVLYVRGNEDYGKNRFKDKGDGTVKDEASGLTWMKSDSGKGMNWQAALKYAEDLELGGHSDWRLPNAKELQSIVDYSRSPDTSKSAAIAPIFKSTPIKNEGGSKDFASYWSSTSHKRGYGSHAAVYVAFGRSLGWMEDRRSGERTLMDVHGAGSQRSDPKSGDASEFPYGRGPQGDVIRIDNFVRCVRGGNVENVKSGPKIERQTERKRPQGGARRQGQGGGPQGGGFIKRLDKDGDGGVSEEEFDGPAQHFQHLDKDGDGLIREDEAPTGPPANRRRER